MNWYQKNYPYVLAVVALAVSLTVRIFSYHIVTADYTASLSHWMDALRAPGLSAFGELFSNYAPMYLYFLKILTFIPVNELYLIKTLSLIFDILLAVMMVIIVKSAAPKKYSRAKLFMIGSIAFAIPTLFLNSSVWGQCDSIFTFFTLWSLYLLIKERPYWAAIVFGLAISIKLQAIFFLPVILGYILARKKDYFAVFVIPLVFLASIVPAWLNGGSFVKLATIYLMQANEFSDLTLFAPSVFAFIGNSVSATSASILSISGQIIAFVSALVMGYLTMQLRRTNQTYGPSLVFLGLVSAIVIPFFLPHMHERYFYLADVLAFSYAWISPKKWYVPVLIISASMFSYIPFLSGSIPSLFKYSVSLWICAIFVLVALIFQLSDLKKLRERSSHGPEYAV